jgi:hypothetical protein
MRGRTPRAHARRTATACADATQPQPTTVRVAVRGRSSLGVVHVELLFWDGCPSHPRALAELRAAMADLGLDPSTIAVREIHTREDALRERFVGSPTIRIDGVDVRPPPDTELFELTCRVYYRRDGRVSPTPDPADVRDALTAAANTATTPTPTTETTTSTPTASTSTHTTNERS